jgi:hypothetical protein
MNAHIESTLTLEEVARHVEQWRSHKKKGERIPQRLWNEALGLVDTYGVSRVSRTLHLSYTELDKRRRIIEAEQRRQGPGEDTAFVEIDHGLVDRAPRSHATTAWMELERPDGLRLRIRPTHGVELLALVDRFMGV